MDRRDFVRKTAAGIAYTLIVPAVIKSQDTVIPYSEAVAQPEKRQEFLDQTLSRAGSNLRYIKELKYYGGEPVELFGTDIISDFFNGEKGHFEASINSKKLSDSYAFTPFYLNDFGSGKKSEVFVFKRPFGRLLADELGVCIRHEDHHCTDISKGITINGHAVDVNKLKSDVFEDVGELRAYFLTYSELAVAMVKYGKELLESVSQGFIDEMGGYYAYHYRSLAGKMEKGLGGYDADVAREHLLSLGDFIKPEFRFK